MIRIAQIKESNQEKQICRKISPKLGTILSGYAFCQQGINSYWEKTGDDSLILTTMQDDDTWNALSIKHTTLNVKRWVYSHIPGGTWDRSPDLLQSCTKPYKTWASNCRNSLTPGKFEWIFWVPNFTDNFSDGWGISCELAVRWMSLDLSDDKSTLVQVMAWCRQATSHYLNQCWPRSPTPYGVIRPQWVNLTQHHAPNGARC